MTTPRPSANPGVPLLGQRPQRVTIAPSFSVLPRNVAADNTIGTIGQGEAVPREWFMDAEQLLSAIQGIVRHELRAALTRAGMVILDEEAPDALA